jgi:hypothetical protein
MTEDYDIIMIWTLGTDPCIGTDQKVQTMGIKIWGNDPQPRQLQRHVLPAFISRLGTMGIARRCATCPIR